MKKQKGWITLGDSLMVGSKQEMQQFKKKVPNANLKFFKEEFDAMHYQDKTYKTYSGKILKMKR